MEEKTAAADLTVVTGRDPVCTPLGEKQQKSFYQEGRSGSKYRSGHQISPVLLSQAADAWASEGPTEGKREQRRRGFDGLHLRAPGRMWAANLHLPLIKFKWIVSHTVAYPCRFTGQY